MRTRLTVFLIIGLACIVGLLFMRELVRHKGMSREGFVDKKVRVLTYKSFVSPNGPGPEIFKAFESVCDCKVDVTSVSDAGLMLERLKIGLGGATFDIVIGLDQLMLDQARKEFAWRELEVEDMEWNPDVAEYAKSNEFVPMDWSPLSFVYRAGGAAVPQKLSDLTQTQYTKQFILEDPRASSPGLQFYNWIKAVQGDKTEEFLRAFKANVHTVAPNWSFAYGLFQKKEGRFVFSYLTSLAFHWGIEKDRGYQVLQFPEGHPVQVEYLAIPAQCRQCELAVQLMESMLTPENQRVIMEKNFMLPVIQGVEKDSVYAELPKLKKISIESGKDLRAWEQVFSR